MNGETHCLLNKGFIIRLIHVVHRMEHAAEHCFFAPYGLSMSTGQILMCLYRAGEQTPTSLSAFTGSKKSNMTQRISQLKKAGLISLKEGASSDRRNVVLELTAKGRKIADEMDAILQKNIRELESEFTEEQKENVLQLIDSMNRKLNSIECHHE